MGQGQVSSYRWQHDRTLTSADKRRYWETRALQAEAELRCADATLQRLARRIVRLEAELGDYRRAFGPIVFTDASQMLDE